MTNLVLPDKGDNNWDVVLDAALYQLEDSIDAKLGWELVAVPSTATAVGVLGQIAVDTNYVYICVTTNTWRRLAITAW